MSEPAGDPKGPPYPPPPGGEWHWPPQLTVAVAIALQVLLPNQLSISNAFKWTLPALEGVMLVALFIASPQRLEAPHSVRRVLTLGITAIVSVANGISLVLLAHLLLNKTLSSGPQGHQLIIAGSEIWLTNVLIFALWYWEIDRGGPGVRAAGFDDRPDFQFPHMTDEVAALYPGWRPRFPDYLYLSLTNASALSPTDTMPLSTQAKMIMGFQSLISLVTIGLVVSRAVNIL
ncbi:MAG TPA: hypothetical protein VG293_06550 [Solirubrobacteraceae bacterium]|jgi:uncharacterized membrane protein|nr:hypothetical protein [Solirubrobacteraceae bacterium]